MLLSSSFGIQAAVSLHLVNQIRPDIPVILTDTGYLFPETYQFIDELTDKLKLNLKVYRATESAAWQEARYGKLWEQGVEGIEKYNEINKVEPMNRALKELNAQTWFAGLRREQSGSRATLPVLAVQRGVFKVLPIIDWDNRTVYQYLQKHGLKYHPWISYLSVAPPTPPLNGNRDRGRRGPASGCWGGGAGRGVGGFSFSPGRAFPPLHRGHSPPPPLGLPPNLNKRCLRITEGFQRCLGPAVNR